MSDQPTQPTEQATAPQSEAAPQMTPQPDPVAPSQEVPAPTRQPAMQVLSAFLEEKGIEFSVPPVKVRSIEDGSIILDAPNSIIVKYKDE